MDYGRQHVCMGEAGFAIMAPLKGRTETDKEAVRYK